jgi:hypothetical protein
MPAFWPAWGFLNEVHAQPPKTASWQALSTTLPPHNLKTVDEKLSLSSSHCLIQPQSIDLT